MTTKLEQRLADEMKAAMRAKDTARLTVIRMLRSKLQEKTVELRGKHGRDHQLTDEQALEVVGAYAKQRRDSIEAYRQGGRDDLADKEQAELDLVSGYLPEQLSEDALRELVQEAIAETGASSPKDMGKVMQAVMPKTKGRADGKQISAIARQLLTPS